MNNTTNKQNSERNPNPKAPTNPTAKLIDYIVKESTVKHRITGHTNQICQFEGNYYYEQDPEQTTYVSQGSPFPPVHIRPQKEDHGGGRIDRGTWVLHEEESPYKSLRRPISIVLFIILAIGLTSLAIVAPWILIKLINALTYVPLTV